MSKRWCLGETCLSVMVLLAEKTCQISNIPKSKVIRAEALSCRDIARRWDGLEGCWSHRQLPVTHSILQCDMQELFM